MNNSSIVSYVVDFWATVGYVVSFGSVIISMNGWRLANGVSFVADSILVIFSAVGFESEVNYAVGSVSLLDHLF